MNIKRLDFEITGDTPSFEFNPDDYVDCESAKGLERQLCESAEEQATWGARLIGVDIERLWEQVKRRAERLSSITAKT